MSELADTELFQHDARGAGDLPVGLWRIAPILCAAAYPFLSQMLSWLLVVEHGSASPGGLALWFGVAGSLLLALGIMGAAFASARMQTGFRSRAAAHIVFATPSLFVGFGYAANLAAFAPARDDRLADFLGGCRMAVLVPRTVRKPAALIEAGRIPAAWNRARDFGISHWLVLFVAPHLANHTAGLLSGTAHIGFMKEARQLYRATIFEPLLLTLIGFQVASGTLLVRRRLRNGSDFFGSLQTMTGVYVGIYFLAHLTAVFGARYAGTDTNWSWLTNTTSCWQFVESAADRALLVWSDCDIHTSGLRSEIGAARTQYTGTVCGYCALRCDRGRSGCFEHYPGGTAGVHM